ncbi:MAG: DNA alkylation repair protein [Clostridia bacterium]|nr:DNA alkylation repair protein [Clostridia bacterium]
MPSSNAHPVIEEIKESLEGLSKQTGLKTETIRELSSKSFNRLEDKSIDFVIGLCQRLLEERQWELGVIAYDWAFRVKKQYCEATFEVFEDWLEQYVSGWGDCDDFCTHAFGELLTQYPYFFQRVAKWTEHPDFWVRRAAAVILIYPIKKGRLQDLNPYLIANLLMEDDHDLVLKGYGWMLKVLSCYQPDDVREYLEQNHARMPRVAFRYAIEKYPAEVRQALMAL